MKTEISEVNSINYFYLFLLTIIGLLIQYYSTFNFSLITEKAEKVRMNF